MHTSMIDMFKYAQKIGFILWLLLCLPGILEARSLEQPPSEQIEMFASEELPPSSTSWWITELEKNHPGALVITLIIIIISCIFCSVILLIWILINRNKMHTRQAETNRLLEEFDTQLFDYLTKDDKEYIFKQIARTALYDFNREILITQMRELSKSMNMSKNVGVNDAAKLQLRDLYYRMHLDKDSIRKLYSSKWHIQVKGFRELAFMDVTEANDKLFQALKSKNNIVRMEAQLALIRLNRHDPFAFLDYLTHPFTLWEQLTVYELIVTHSLPIPQFSRWTDSNNKTVVIFALRMIHVFKQQNASPHVILCLQHADRDIRQMAIHVCGEIQLREALPTIKNMYKDEDYANCLAIVHAISKMPDESMLGFLKLVLDKEDDVQLQIESAKAISKMGEVGISALVKLIKSEYKNYQIIIRHILDKRIS